MSDAVMLRARDRAARLYRSAGFRTAYENGAAAAVAGRTADSCPYRRDATKTWGTAYRKAWIRGFESIAGSVDA